MIDSFIDRASKMDVSAKGGNKACYLFPSYALLRGSLKVSEVEFVMQKQQELAQNAVNVVPIVAYKEVIPANELGYSRGYILQRKAQGEPLHAKSAEKKDYMDTIANLAQEQDTFYDKFASDWLAIEKSGLKIDPSKSTNFFYEKGEKLNFIDLDQKKSPIKEKYHFMEMSAVLLGGGKFFNHYNENDKANTQNAVNVISKLKKSFIKLGYNESAIDNDIANQYPEIAQASLNKNNKFPNAVNVNKVNLIPKNVKSFS